MSSSTSPGHPLPAALFRQDCPDSTTRELKLKQAAALPLDPILHVRGSDRQQQHNAHDECIGLHVRKLSAGDATASRVPAWSEKGDRLRPHARSGERWGGRDPIKHQRQVASIHALRPRRRILPISRSPFPGSPFKAASSPVSRVFRAWPPPSTYPRFLSPSR